MSAPRWVSDAYGRAVIIRKASRAVTVTRSGLDAFARRWPCAGFPDKPVTFCFDSNGLCDVLPNGWQASDESATVALSEDCEAMLIAALAAQTAGVQS